MVGLLNDASQILRVVKVGGFPLTLIVSLTTVLRTMVLHCDQTVSALDITIKYVAGPYSHRVLSNSVPAHEGWPG